jgi:hypothetical protein
LRRQSFLLKTDSIFLKIIHLQEKQPINMVGIGDQESYQLEFGSQSKFIITNKANLRLLSSIN